MWQQTTVLLWSTSCTFYNFWQKRVRIGKDFVFYDPHIQKIAEAQRHYKVQTLQKRGQLRIYSTIRIFLEYSTSFSKPLKKTLRC